MTDNRNQANAGATIGDGNNVTIGNSDDAGEKAFTIVNPATSGTIVYDDDNCPTGVPWSFLLTNATANLPVAVGWTDTAGTSFRARGIFHLNGSYGSLGSIGLHTRTGADAQGVKAYINDTGKLEISTNAATVATGTVTLSNTAHIRIECEATGLNSAATVINARAYNEHSTTPLDTITSGTITTTINVGACRWGRFAGTGGPINVTGLAFDIGSSTPYGPLVTNVLKTGTDTISFSDVSLLIDNKFATDSLTQSEGVANIALTAFDSWYVTEEVTETSAEDSNEVITLTDVVTSLTTDTVAEDELTFGDNVTQSIPTGDQAFAWGGALSNSYFVAAEADSFDLGVGSRGLIYDADGIWLDNTVYEITSISPPTSGFVNIFVTPDFAFTPASGDVFKEITPAGAFLDMSTDLTDTQTMTDVSSLAVSLSRTDSFSFSDTSTLDQSAAKVGTDSFGFTDTSALTQNFVATDSAVQSEGATLLARDSTATDTQTLTDTSSTTADLTASDTQTLSESSSASPVVAGTDTQTLNEQAVVLDVSAVATDIQTLTDVASLTTADAKVATDSATQTEGTVTLTAAVQGSETHTTTDVVTTHTSATTATDAQLLSGEQSSVSGGGNPTGSDSWTMDEVSEIQVSSDGTDTFGFADASALSAALEGSDSLVLSEAPAEITQSYALVDSQTMSEDASLQMHMQLVGEDISFLQESSHVAVNQFLSRTDQQNFSEVAVLAVFIESGDSFAQTEGQVSGVALLEATDDISFQDEAEAAGFQDKAGFDSIIMTEFAFVVQDDISDNAFPHLHVKFPGVVPEGNIRFPSTEE